MPARVFRALFFFAVFGCCAAGALAADESPLGTWYLNAGRARLTAIISRASGRGAFSGSITNKSGGRERLDAIAWDAASGRLEFRRDASGIWQWYRGTVVEGVFVGRYSENAHSEARPAQLEAFRFHVTGWNAAVFDRALVPRVFELLISGEYRARLRIDRDPRGRGYTGRFKIYATVSAGADGEQLEDDVEITKWDGKRVSFVRRLGSSTQTFSGAVNGRTLSGTYAETGKPETIAWTGTRADVLSFGLTAKPPAERAAWQRLARGRLLHLMMAGNPAPLASKVTVLRSDFAPFASQKFPLERDDDPAHWPQTYRLTELQFDFTIPNPYGGPSIERRAHAYLAVPSTPPPAGGKYPAILAVNGHGGSAWKLFDLDHVHYWHGDAFARRGFVVLALDISHRPVEDRRLPDGRMLYSGSETGDDAEHGNGPHPAIKAAGFDSDWEEDGERVWDAMRALDYLLALPQVDAARVGVTGLSMGGTITALVSALDSRVTFSLPAAPSSDFGVMFYKGNHSCWLWQRGEVREYFDASDLFALFAPRPLVVISGKQDFTYSKFPQPFVNEKQVLRRARAAYAGDAAKLVHYLHYDGHRYHVGDTNPAQPRETGVRTPLRIEPSADNAQDWQTDPQTTLRAPTLFDLLKEFWKAK